MDYGMKDYYIISVKMREFYLHGTNLGFEVMQTVTPLILMRVPLVKKL
jgi:hypothetical protein